MIKKICLEKLGILRYAEFELGGLTIICGENNTGKTYASYALFGFLNGFRDFLDFSLDQDDFSHLASTGSVEVDLYDWIPKIKDVVDEGCKSYSRLLWRTFAGNADYFDGAKFQIHVDVASSSSYLLKKFSRGYTFGENQLLDITKENGTTKASITLAQTDRQNVPKLPRSLIQGLVSEALCDMLLSRILPRPFIASTERTGAAIFRKELDFARNRLLEKISEKGNDIDPLDLFERTYQDYALPVKNNADFIRQLETVSKETSFLIDQHPQIFADFDLILGGEYRVKGNDTISYKPKQKRVQLALGESSSSVRSLLDIGFYLKHVARPGDILIVDEPELNLHPKNQRLLARLFAKLVNVGIKVLFTTHSDYMVKEISNLVRLNQGTPYIEGVAREFGYDVTEILSAEDVKAYVAKEARVLLHGNKRRSKINTLCPMPVSQDQGISIETFDESIKAMNELDDALTWGDYPEDYS